MSFLDEMLSFISNKVVFNRCMFFSMLDKKAEKNQNENIDIIKIIKIDVSFMLFPFYFSINRRIKIVK